MDEPNALIRWTMFHFASGEAFFVGLGLLALAWFVIGQEQSRRRRAWVAILTALGFVWCWLSSTPLTLNMWLAMLLMLVGMCGIVWKLTRLRSTTASLWPHYRVLVPPALLAAPLVFEFSHQDWSPPQLGVVERLCVIADSVTAGLNENETTWPQLLADRGKIEVVDASQPGATLHSAIQQAELIGDRKGLVLLEIGGNDLLEKLPTDRFEDDLQRLLGTVSSRPGRKVVMFELPLPPGSARYGAIQRRLAARYDITLIPKRKLIGLLTSHGATVDSIHLSPRGHAAMCDLVMQLFEIPAGSGSYVRLERDRI